MNAIKKYIPNNLVLMLKYIKYNLCDGYATKSYSQEGEDIILKRFFEGNKNGFYIDVGAHHPKRFSNTYLFYKMGWRGINIDPNHDAINLFNKKRPRDINLECGISDTEGRLNYYMFEEPAFNSFSEEYATRIEDTTNNRVIEKKIVDVYRLSNILPTHISLNDSIEFLSVDAEAYDINVLRSNDWSKFRPHIVLVEELNFSFGRSQVYKYLTGVDYIFLAKTFNSVFYVDKLGKAQES
jgi:FkbM family methyltransferase